MHDKLKTRLEQIEQLIREIKNDIESLPEPDKTKRISALSISSLKKLKSQRENNLHKYGKKP